MQLTALCTLTLAIDRDAVIVAERAHTGLCPGIISSRAFARSVEKGGDAHIGHQSREFTDDVSRRCIQGPAMLTVPRFWNLEFAVVFALPMEHQMDFIALPTRDNLCNAGAKDACAFFRRRRSMVPCALHVRAKC